MALTIPELVQKSLVAFGLPVNTLTLGVVTERLTSIQDLGQTLVLTEIEKLLTSIESFSAALNLSADAGGLIKAGELQWSEGGRLGGVTAQRADHLARLAGLLNLQGLIASQPGFAPYGTVRVIRG